MCTGVLVEMAQMHTYVCTYVHILQIEKLLLGLLVQSCTPSYAADLGWGSQVQRLPKPQSESKANLGNLHEVLS